MIRLALIGDNNEHLIKLNNYLKGKNSRLIMYVYTYIFLQVKVELGEL